MFLDRWEYIFRNGGGLRVHIQAFLLEVLKVRQLLNLESPNKSKFRKNTTQNQTNLTLTVRSRKAPIMPQSHYRNVILPSVSASLVLCLVPNLKQKCLNFSTFPLNCFILPHKPNLCC